MSSHIFDGICHTGDPISFGIGNFNGKFILNGHYDLHGIEGVQSQIIGEFGRGGHFSWVDFVEIFDDGDDSFLHFGGVEEGLVWASELGGE